MVDPWVFGASAAGLLLVAELVHRLRIARVRYLTFGPSGRPAVWTHLVPLIRSVAAGFLAWGLATLLFGIEAKTHSAATGPEDEWRHLVLVLDVSPSMRLVDAGPDGEQSRLHRARDVLQSMFGRVSIGRFKISVVATYTGAIPVVVDTTDAEVVNNVLGDLPMHYAFKSGETRLFDGLEEAFRVAADWLPASTTVVVASDGDTVPPTGMPKMPASVSGVLVVGVGDPVTGSFIGGRNSRQDVSALRQIALRLGGTYHDGNKRHVATTVLQQVVAAGKAQPLVQLSRREYALLACALGAALLALMPLCLQLFGSRWQSSLQGRREPRRRSPEI